MSTGGDITELLRPYLQKQHAVSEEALRHLVSEWDQQGSFLEFLVAKRLLPRATARTLEAVRKGYLDATLESVLGLPGRQSALAAPPWESVAAPAPSAALAEAVAPQSLRPLAPGRPPLLVKPTVGLRIGRYLLQEQLGEGATATVFRSFHESLNLPVAIKVFAPIDEAVDPEASARFRQEARTLVRLEHPHIVRILDADIAGPFPYIVMEYVGETTLETQLRNLGRLPAPRIAKIGRAVAGALEAARQAGLLHRDIKPSNILERRDGFIKLVDFGIVAQLLPGGGLSDPQAAQGHIAGTPLYIAPEQVMRPASIDFRADMYGLGATLYHAAVGRPPLVRDTAAETMMAHVHDEPVPICELDPGFDAHLAATIHRMLRKRPEERFGSWSEVRAALAYRPESESRSDADSGHSPSAGAPSDGIEFADPATAAELAQDAALLRALPPLPNTPARVSRTRDPLLRRWDALSPSRQAGVVGGLLLLALLAYVWFTLRM